MSILAVRGSVALLLRYEGMTPMTPQNVVDHVARALLREQAVAVVLG